MVTARVGTLSALHSSYQFYLSLPPYLYFWVWSCVSTSVQNTNISSFIPFSFFWQTTERVPAVCLSPRTWNPRPPTPHPPAWPAASCLCPPHGISPGRTRGAVASQVSSEQTHPPSSSNCPQITFPLPLPNWPNCVTYPKLPKQQKGQNILFSCNMIGKYWWYWLSKWFIYSVLILDPRGIQNIQKSCLNSKKRQVKFQFNHINHLSQ